MFVYELFAGYSERMNLEELRKKTSTIRWKPYRLIFSLIPPDQNKSEKNAGLISVIQMKHPKLALGWKCNVEQFVCLSVPLTSL